MNGHSLCLSNVEVKIKIKKEEKGLLPAHQNGAVGVVHDVITDAAKKGASEKAHAATSGHDEIRFLLLCHGNNGFPSVSVLLYKFSMSHAAFFHLLRVFVFQSFYFLFDFFQKFPMDMWTLRKRKMNIKIKCILSFNYFFH